MLLAKTAQKEETKKETKQFQFFLRPKTAKDTNKKRLGGQWGKKKKKKREKKNPMLWKFERGLEVG